MRDDGTTSRIPWEEAMNQKAPLKRSPMKKKPPTPYLQGTTEWAQQFDHCWLCHCRGAWPTTLVVHHLVRGAFRVADELSTTFICCPRCHEVQHTQNAAIGLHGCLAIKRLEDKDNYNLERFCVARGRAGSSITEDEVLAAAEILGICY
jgi:hypothetical protein